MKQFLIVAIALAFVAGCQQTNSAEQQAKREQDRMAMQLADAERDRDTYKAQIDQLRAAASEAAQKQMQAQQQLDAVNSQLKKVQDEAAAAKSNQATFDQLTTRLEDAQAQLTASHARVAELQQQIAALKAQSGGATTRPYLNK